MPIAWRIVKKRYAASAFDGEGARQNGGRWTRVGRRAVYTAGSVSLATLEILVQLGIRRLSVLESYSLFKVDIPDDLVLGIDPDTLPERWFESPPPNQLCLLGDLWLNKGKEPVLRVPSAIVTHENNYILNPEHSDFGQIAIGPEEPFSLDPRLTGGAKSG